MNHNGHELGILLAAATGLVVVVLLGVFLWRRSHRIVEEVDTDHAQRVEERLATGHFSRRDSRFRRKAFVEARKPEAHTESTDTHSPQPPGV